MTVELQLPDDLAGMLLALPEPERSQWVASALRRESPATSAPIADDEVVPGEPKLGPDGHYRIMDFYGIGRNRPGAVGDDVEGYLSSLRSEWDGRDFRSSTSSA